MSDVRANNALAVKSGVVFAAMLASLALWESSGEHVERPYRDIGGVWTVCDGITGPDVIPSRTYTVEQCAQLRDRAIRRIEHKLLSCIRVPMEPRVHFAMLHWAYNVGPNAACGSTALRKLNNGDTQGACRELMRWVFVRKKDCTDRENKCYGLVSRRTFESQLCSGKVAIPLVGEVSL